MQTEMDRVRPSLLTIDQVADRLAVSRPTIYRLMREGRLPWVQIGGTRRVSETAIAEYIERNTERGVS